MLHVRTSTFGTQSKSEILSVWCVQLQQACLLAELLLAVLLQRFAETNGDPTALSRLGDNRVSSGTAVANRHAFAANSHNP